MRGQFQYSNLKQRLLALQRALDNEVSSWTAARSSLKQDLRKQYTEVCQKKGGIYDVLIVSLIKDSPLAWQVTYIGREKTLIEGAAICFNINIPPKFPQEYPRIRLMSKLFHPHISPDGFPLFSIKVNDRVSDYVEQVIDLLERPPKSNPMTHLNTQAARKCFGNEQQKFAFKQQFQASAY